MSLLDRLRRTTARVRGRRHQAGDTLVVADEQTSDDRALNSSHFDDVDYYPASDDED